MDASELIDALARPDAFPEPVDRVEVRQTHISIVFLAGDYVYKIKKPVRLEFLDFSTLDRREHFCREELRLNARLAAEVYLDVVPVTRQAGQMRFEGAGAPIEWAVKMRRLPDDATLENRLCTQQVCDAEIVALAGQLADFHRQAERSPHIAQFGRWDIVAGNARDNFLQSRAQIGTTISSPVFDRLQAAMQAALEAQRPLIEQRAARGVPCDTHGDLRTDHVYLLDRSAQHAAQTVVIDCIEFNEAFRFADPVADLAFLAMDLKFIGHERVARLLTDAYFAAAGDEEARRLLPLYTSYRAAVRAKVEGLKQAEAEVPPPDRQIARRRAQAYWLMSLGELVPARQRPCLILVGGLPGSGKSTLAAQLAGQANFQLIRSDVVRKQLAGAQAADDSRATFGSGLYTPQWNERTYAECLRQAEAQLFDGQRVLVDASFREDARREQFLSAAAHWRVPTALLLCQAPPEAIRARLAGRRGDASDADWTIYQAASEAWEAASLRTAQCLHSIDTGGTREQALLAALQRLAGLELVELGTSAS